MRIALLALFLFGCSSLYMPQAPGRVAISIQGGKPVYVRDGKVYEDGAFGGGLVDAVAGNPAAEQAAATYHSRRVTGFVAILIGALTVGAGTAVAVVGGGSQDLTLPIALLGSGLVAVIIGAAFTGGSEPYRWDAINLFNDGGAGPAPAGGPAAPGRQGLPPPPPPPPPMRTTFVTGTLHMRD